MAQRLNSIRQNLPETVRLIAVSKNVSAEAIREAYDLGVRDFAESRIQDALLKQEQLQSLSDICWHFIGHLQGNKAKKALQNFQWIHTCDSLKLAERLDRLVEELGSSRSILLQVKALPDDNKSGWMIPELRSDLPKLNEYKNLNIQGLMTILPLGLSADQNLEAFTKIRDLGNQIDRQNYANLEMKEFSMGMSGDYLTAVKAGSTMIRLGSIIFG